MKIKFKMQDRYLKVLERVKNQLKMVDIVLGFKKVLVIDQHASISMK